MYQVLSRRVVASVVSLAALALPAASAFAASSPAATVSPVRVEAHYKITLNGFDLGTFRFKSDVGRTRYALETSVEISALLGVFHWKGVTHASGTVAAKAPSPSSFRFDFESTARNGSISMGFDKGTVDSLVVLPVMVDAPDTVPLERTHLKGVFDPLSAIMALTHSDAPAPCGRKVNIFDGKQRFDIDLRFAREELLQGTQGEKAIVCRIKYTPIAGYRQSEETRQLATTNNIEIGFRPVPAAKLMIPQFVSVPTAAGTARIDLTRVNIELPENGQLASAD